MPTIRLYNYLPARDKHWLDNIIAGWTLIWNVLRWPTQAKNLRKLLCSHSEIGFPDRHTGEPMMATSTMRYAKGKNGVVCRPASEVLKHPERWTYFELPISETGLYRLQWVVDTQISKGVGYDKKAIASFFLPFRVHDKDKEICSEESVHLLWNCDDENVAMICTNYPVPSPLRLAYLVWKAGYDLYSLKTGEVILPARSKKITLTADKQGNVVSSDRMAL